MNQHLGTMSQPLPGSIVSQFGARRYYSVEPPKNKSSASGPPKPKSFSAESPRRETTANRKPKDKPEAEPRREAQPGDEPHQGRPITAHPSNETATQTKFRPLALNESSTQTDAKKPAVARFTQTNTDAASPRRQIHPVDAATSPINVSPIQPRQSHENFSMITEDYQRVLSRHSDDLWDARRSVSFEFAPSDDDDVGDIPTPYPIRHVGVMTDRLLDNKPIVIKERLPVIPTHSKATQAVLPMQAYSYASYVNKEASPKRIVIKQKRPQPPLAPVYIVQSNQYESDSDDEPTHHVYGPHGQPLHFLPMSMRGYQNPHLLSQFPMTQSQYQTPVQPADGGSYRMRVRLEYGYIADGLGTQVLPDAVQQELLKEYGHVKDTEVVIMKQNGNYSMHSHSHIDGKY